MSSASEVREIRGLARDFAAAQLRPHAERWDADRALDDDVTGSIAELGFFGMLVPEDRGGMGFDTAIYVSALEELAWGEPAVALLVAQSVIAADVLVRHGGDDHGSLIEALALGQRLGCIALAPDDGSGDARGPAAARTDDGWQLSGTSPWVTNGAGADVAVVLASIAGADEAALFAVERDAGFRTGPAAATMGLRAVPLVELDVDGVNVPSNARLAWSGPDSRGAIDPLGSLSAAAIAVGISQAALDHAVRYANEREQFGRPIRQFEGIQVKLAEMSTRTVAARCLIERAAAAADVTSAAMAKLAAGSCAMYVTTEAVQIFGGYGYMRDYPVEKLMRDARAMEMLHGTSEMQRLRIAAALYTD